jgi:hypothetical protein
LAFFLFTAASLAALALVSFFDLGAEASFSFLSPAFFSSGFLLFSSSID